MTMLDLLNGTFGFNPNDGHHHFLVMIPASDVAGSEVSVYECLRYSEKSDGELPVGSIERVRFPISIWNAISEDARAAFNLRLKEGKRKPGKWRSGPNYLAAHYGKELVLLGWAFEGVAADRVDTVFRNWRGLAPEERWWLYSTANAPFSQNSRRGRGIGWRKALTIALSENPLIDSLADANRPTSTIETPKPRLGDGKLSATRKGGVKKKSQREQLEEHITPSEIEHSAPSQQTLFDI
jgi:hypothetical protein